MASTHVEIDPNSTRLSSEFTNVVRQVRQTMERVDWMLARVETLATGDDWASLGAALGVSTGDAQTIYNLLVAARARIAHADIQNFCNRLG